MIDSGQIIGLYFLVPIWGIYGVAWGTVIGAILALAIQFPAFFQRRISNHLRLNLRLAGIREILHLMWPRVITDE